MKTAEEILNKHLDSDRTKESILKCMEEYRQQSYASQPMSAEPYTLDNGMGTATLMRTEQVEELDKYRKNAEEDYLTTPISVLRYITGLERVTKATIPTVKDGWVSVEECKKREQDAYYDGYNTGISHGKPIGY